MSRRASGGSGAATALQPHGHSNGAHKNGRAAAERSASPARTVQEVTSWSWHQLMWIPLILLFPASIISFGYVAEMVEERTAHMAANAGQYNWTYPQFADLTVTLWSLLILLFLRVTLCKYVFTPLGDWFLPSLAEKKGKWTAEAREDRIQRFAACMFKLLYFLFITIYGYITLKDCDWLPPELFGSGSVSNSWNGWPYSEVSESVKRYYLISLSYHAHSLVFHLFTTHRNDFVEMTLHHTCATLLVVFSYYANFVRIGVMVLFLHDLADVFAYAVKAVVDSKHTKATLTAYAGLLVTWGYTRLYVFPFHVIAACRIPGVEAGLVWNTSYAMIWMLQALHVYWYILFLIMGYRFLLSGKTMDIQQKAGEQDGSYKDYHKKHVREEEEELQRKLREEQSNGNGDHSEEAAVAPEQLTRRTRSGKKASRRAD